MFICYRLVASNKSAGLQACHMSDVQSCMQTSQLPILFGSHSLADHRGDDTLSITVDNVETFSYLLLSNFNLLTNSHLLPLNDFYWSELVKYYT